MDANVSNVVNASNATFKDDVFAWSADSSQLLFASTRARSPQFDIFRMEDDGSGIVRLTFEVASQNGTPDW